MTLDLTGSTKKVTDKLRSFKAKIHSFELARREDYKNLNYKPVIICTGAAIAFLTKRQAPINIYVDKFYMGWLMRIIYNPKIFLYRTLRSVKLIKFFI